MDLSMDMLHVWIISYLLLLIISYLHFDEYLNTGYLGYYQVLFCLLLIFYFRFLYFFISLRLIFLYPAYYTKGSDTETTERH